MSIEHADPQLTIKRAMKFGGEEQDQETKLTTDGKANKNKLPSGSTLKSKTRWDGVRLVTKSSFDTPMGSREIVEARSLSPDGKTMTIEQTTKGNGMEWTRKLVYNKE
jgi:hypothetical protein